jgi:hypothetical protein
MIDWQIQSRSHSCQECLRTFQDQEKLHTLLLDERQGYARKDVCEACWTGKYAETATQRRGYVSHWQGQYVPPPAAPVDPIQKETAETLLRKLVARNDPQHAGACFILAVMLERKRLLRSKAQQVIEGNRVLLYEQPKTGDLFTIPYPDLRLDQLEAVQRDVAHLLKGGPDGEGVAEAAALTPGEPAAPPPETAPATEDNPPPAPEGAGETPPATPAG